MRWIGVAVKQCNRVTVRACILGLLDQFLNRLLTNWGSNRPPVQKPLVYLKDHRAFHQWLGPRLKDVQGIANPHSLELQQVAVAVGHEESDFRPLALDHGIRAHGRAVHDDSWLAVLGSQSLQQQLEALAKALLESRRRRRNLQADDFSATAFSPPTEVCEGAAYVNADANHCKNPLVVSQCRSSNARLRKGSLPGR